MDINGSVSSGELEFVIELDTDEVWEEIRDGVTEVAYDIAREEVQNAATDIDYAAGASSLLSDYNPGNGCSLARQFEMAVRGAVQVDDFLKDVVVEQIRNRERAASNVNETATGGVDDIGRIRAVVREEIRLALTSVASQITSVV